MRVQFHKYLYVLLVAAVAPHFFLLSNSEAGELERYGGLTNVACPSGPRPHFYTQKIGDRWWLCDPAGHGFFMKGVIGVNYTWPASVTLIKSKYGSAFNPYVTSSAEDSSTVWYYNYMIGQVNRLHEWGFNFLAEEAMNELWPTTIDPRWNTADHSIPDQFKMPFTTYSNSTRYIMLPQMYTYFGCSTSYPMKDMINGAGSAFTAYHYSFGDYFDPHIVACLSLMWNSVLSPIMSAPHNDYLLYVSIDEGDQTGFLDAGPDFPIINPNGTVDPNMNANPHSAHPAWVTLATDPVQASATVLGYTTTYVDKEVHSKVQLANDLLNHYLNVAAGTYSIDPAAANYAGVANMTAATNALNTAWGSNYTTLSTSDPNCTSSLASCLQNGTYSSWGTGTGLLDENGTCPSKGASSCWIGDDITLNGETTTMQADMSAFLTHYLDQYFSAMTAPIHQHAPGILTQMNAGGWYTPPRKEVLTEEAKYLDLPLAEVPPPYCPTCTDIQQRIDFMARYLGDRPWMMWEGFYANPDSAESANVAPYNVATTQAGRGAVYQQMMTGLINAKSTVYNDYPVLGLYWWAMYDSQGLNWGLCTPSDNPYDGVSATLAGVNGARGKDPWGYRTGDERKDYGDFIDLVRHANFVVDSPMASRRKR